MNRLKNNKLIILIVSLSFVASLGYSFYFKIKPLVDARAYDTIAQNIASGEGYRENLEVSIENDPALLRVGPVYEYFLAVIYKAFGHHYEFVWVAQAILHALSAFLLYLSVLLIFKWNEQKKKIALWAAGLFAFYPDLIEISAMLMTETLYLFFVCLLAYVFFRYIDSPSKSMLVFLGVVSGLSVLARPPVLFILPVVVFYFLKNKRWKEILVYIFILCAVFTPWTARNYKIYGRAMPFGVAGSVNFWIGNHEGANGEQESSAKIDNFIRTHGVVEMERESLSQFKNYVFDNTGDFARLTVLRMNKYFSILRPMGFWFYSSGWRQALFVLSSAAFSFLVLILGLGGIIRSVRFKEKSLYYILALTIATPLILFITVVETRYRFQIYPFLAIFSAYFINSLKEDKKIWFGILSLALVIIVLNSLIDGFVNFEHFKDKLVKL